MKEKMTERKAPGTRNYLIVLFALMLCNADKNFAQCSTVQIPTSKCSRTDNITKFKLAGVAISSNCNAENAKMISELGIGETYSFSATSGTLKQWLAVWVDLNNDEQYAPEEMLFSAEAPSRSHLGVITIPAGTLPAGNVNMRVRCKWGGAGIKADQACTPFTWGETEDYHVDLVPSTYTRKNDDPIVQRKLELELLSISPNPVNSIGVISVRSNRLVNIEVRITDIPGRVVYTSRHEVTEGINTLDLDISALPPGGYVLHIINEGTRVAPYRFVKM